MENFYEGFSNDTLWPLYHDLVAKPSFHREWWDAYVRVNQRFAERAAEVAAKDVMLWVQDYQLQLVPQMLRDLRPDLRIGFYLHIPFLLAELFQQLPWCLQILEGAPRRPGRLPADRWRAELRPAGAAARRPQDAPRPGVHALWSGGDREGVPDLDRHRRLREAGPVRGGSRSAPTRSGQQLGNPRKIFLGIDRLDYTKGIYARLRAFAELIADGHVDGRGRRLRAGGDPVARAGRPVPRSSATTSTGWSAASTATTAGSVGPAISYMHSSYPQRGDGRALPCRRHHGRDARSATA